VIWSFVLATIGIAGLWVAGLGRKVGWAMGLGAQVLWIAYAVATGQWGFIVSALAYGFVYARNWLRWQAKEEAEAAYQKVARAVES
jgi:hypothetical protein